MVPPGDAELSVHFFQAEDGIRAHCVTGVQTCALPIWTPSGTWTGKGITSSEAPLAPGHITTLAGILNDRGNGTPVTASFNGETVGINDVLVKYTYNGDMDLSGSVDADDYAQIDVGFARQGE